jgi:hypothetical protein
MESVVWLCAIMDVQSANLPYKNPMCVLLPLQESDKIIYLPTLYPADSVFTFKVFKWASSGARDAGAAMAPPVTAQ